MQPVGLRELNTAPAKICYPQRYPNGFQYRRAAANLLKLLARRQGRRSELGLRRPSGLSGAPSLAGARKFGPLRVVFQQRPRSALGHEEPFSPVAKSVQADIQAAMWRARVLTGEEGIFGRGAQLALFVQRTQTLRKRAWA
jgi:hypothetical protein